MAERPEPPVSSAAIRRPSLAVIREECERIFASDDSLYATEIEFAEAVLALVEVAEAGRALARTWHSSGVFGRPHVPDAIALREALEVFADGA